MNNSMNVRDTARIILLNEKNHILLLKVLPNTIVIDPDYTRNMPFWLTPGGGVEAGETLLDTARRELYEETGITDADFTPAPIFYNESELILRGTPTLFKESFFLARVGHSTVCHDHCNDEEKSTSAGSAWWDIQDLKITEESIFPKKLVAFLESIV